MTEELRPITVMHVTYGDLERSHSDRLVSEGRNQQQIRNHLSSLVNFMTCFGRLHSDPIGDDFGVYFRDRLDEFITWSKEKGLKTDYIKTAASNLRVICKTADQILKEDNIPASFSEAVAYFLERSGFNLVELARDMKIPAYFFRRWIKGENPGLHNRKYVPLLEKKLGLPSGILQSRLRTIITPYSKGNMVLKKKSEYRQKISKLTVDKYLYKQEPTQSLRNEWLELLHFQTSPYLLNGFKRNTSWRVKPIERDPKPVKWYFTVSGGVCRSAEIRWVHASSFFGFLLLPADRGGKGMEEKKLSLAMFSDSGLIIDYIEFRRMRSGGYTKEISIFLNFCLTLLRKETGFLRQSFKFGQCLTPNIPATEWDDWCDKNRDKLSGVLKSLEKGGHIKMGRNPQEAIADIIARQHPISALFEMIKSMESFNVTNALPRTAANHKRNILLIKMLTSNPLRIHHYSIMTYRKDNTGNLYKRGDGAWCLRFDPEDFKNQKGAASRPYNVVLSNWLWPDIEDYLNNYRPFLTKDRPLDFVFLPTTQGIRSSNVIRGWNPATMSMHIFKLTQTFIPDSQGFGAHAFRHIIATDFIKNNPNGYQVVASILHDRLETVLREYAHLKVADGFSFWTEYLDESVKEFNKGGA